ncbi:MAG: hypothetical protein AMJ75_00175 [Phycisphaerae bacterium SM1_79]|nr:MAG: hypothetical protein AMJ75_00175 [Phycisphaerae bacterium SM1_79]
MNTPEVDRTCSIKAWIAFLAAISCLMIYILACVVSPPAWSPDCSKIAILVSPRGDTPDKFALFTYDIAADTHTLLDEVRADGILSAPSWSPDGKWIAYYKVEQPPEVTAPSESDVAEPNQLPNKVPVPADRERTTETVAEFLSEDNLMLPSFIWDILEEKSDETEDPEAFDVKLIIVAPDGSDKRVLDTMKWIGDEEMRAVLAYVRPVWSPDCKCLFYVRAFEGLFYVSSLELATGKTSAHILSSIGTPVLSHDGKWVASYLEDGDTLIVARIDGGLSKYFRLDFDVESEVLSWLDGIFWSKDSNRLFVVAKDTTLHVVDFATGTTEKWIAPDPNHMNAYYTQSTTRDRLYFIAGFEAEQETSKQQKLSLEYVNLEDKRTGSVFEFLLPEISEDEDGGRFSISPDGKTLMFRGVVKDEFEWERSALIFLDGETKKVVKTDRWLFKRLYTEADLVSEDRLIGEWSAEDSRMSIARGTGQGTYKLAWAVDDEEYHAAANLVRLKGLTFLALFLDESILEKKDTSGSHLLPDMFTRVVQMEPKLILQAIEYDELAKALEEARLNLSECGDTPSIESKRD